MLFGFQVVQSILVILLILLALPTTQPAIWLLKLTQLIFTFMLSYQHVLALRLPFFRSFPAIVVLELLPNSPTLQFYFVALQAPALTFLSMLLISILRH